MSNSRPAWQSGPLGAVCLSISLLCLGAGQSARADAPLRSAKSAPTAIIMPLPPAGSPKIEPRIGRARRTPRQDRTAHDSAPEAWLNYALATDINGYSYSVWDYASDGAYDGTMAEWVYDPSGTAVVEGPTYGPYTDVNNTTWAPYSIGVNPTNGHGKILWNRSDGAAGIWTMDANGNVLSVGPTYGPYSDSNGNYWQAISISTANDGTSSLLWVRSDGAMSEWALDDNGNEIAEGPTYGPFTFSDSNGNTYTWSAGAIGTNPSDDTARVLWERSDGLVGVWNMDAYGNYVSGADTTYGPFSDSNTGGNWNPTAIATADDGSSALLWALDTGTGNPMAGGVWGLDSNENVTYVGPTYGPYSDSGGNWAPEYEGLGINPDSGTPDGDTTRILWNRSDYATGIWAMDGGGNQASVGPIYGPYFNP